MNVEALIRENEQSISSGDALEITPQETSTVSDGNYVTMDDLTIMIEKIESTLSTKETIWEKPVEEYTTEEGLLLIIAILLLWYTVKDFIGGIFK